MAINFTTFWTLFGRFAFSGDTIMAAILTTVTGEVEDAVQAIGGSNSIELERTRAGIRESLESFQETCPSLLSGTFAIPVGEHLIQMIKADNQLASDSLNDALRELIKQMITATESLDASTPACTPTYGGSNVGSGTILISTKRGDGQVNEHILAEDIEGTVTDAPTDGLASLGLSGEASTGLLSHDWPKGSGASSTLTSHTSASGDNLVTNGSFETAADATAAPHVPEGWLVQVATLGTTLKITSIEVQTVIMSSAPSAGHYILHWSDGTNTQSTAPLDYNASQSDVAAALSALTDLESVTVVTTGTTPDFTHTITFTGVTNPAQLTSTDNTTGGSIAHATSTAGSAHVMDGARSLEFDSDGAELTTILFPLILEKASQYAISTWWKADVVPAAGVITVDLVSSTTGTVINDDEAVANSFTIDATALSNSAFTHQAGVVRSPSTLPDTVFLRIRISTAVSTGTSLFLDEVCVVEMDQIYTGGLSAALFTGPVRWELDDLITLPVTNDRTGALNEWANRVFELRSNNLLIPTDTGGSETQPDSLSN